MTRDKLILAFVGRLSEEKWFSDALGIHDALCAQGDPAVLLVCGDGPLRNLLHARGDVTAIDGPIPDADTLRSWGVYYFGWRDETDMRAVLSRADYALLPSRFVETFGLAALESLRAGTPVIGPRVGGLAALIPEELAIDLSQSADSLARRILDMWYAGTGHGDTSREARQAIVAAHSRESWLDTARERVLGPDVRRILMVSDYDAPIWGVERHIETISAALRDAGYEVRTFGKKPRHTPIGKLERALDMLGTFVGGWGSRELARTLADFAPDAVWVHSCTKVYGPPAIRLLAGYSGRRIFTYHDFSLFSPFASRMRSLSDVPESWTLGAYMAALGRPSLLERLYLRAKFHKISRLQEKLARFDAHVVPSEFMVPFIERFIGASPSRIMTLPHFLPRT